MTRTPPPNPLEPKNGRRHRVSEAIGLTVNPQAERAYLACLMRNPDARLIVSAQISADHFSGTETREAFEAIAGFIADGTPPDAATLKGAVSDATLIEIETSLSENASAANAHVYAARLRDAKAARDEEQARAWLVEAIKKGRPPHELRAIVEGIEQATRGEGKRRFTGVSDLCELPAAENWLIKGYVALDSLALAFGDPGCGKSFLAIDMACHVATGRPWRGQPVKQGAVLYIAGEGKNGLSKRFKAWFERHGETPRNIEVCTAPIQLVDAGGIAELVAEIRDMPEMPVLIVIDTINRNFGPGDENSTADMTRAVSGLDALRTATGAAILGIHHTGHGDKSRGRGSIVMNASIDMEYRVTKTDRTVQILNTKSKDSDTPPPLAWILEKQVLPWADVDGDPLNSAVLVKADVPDVSATAESLPASQRMALDALRVALAEHGTEERGVVSVAEDQWRKAAYDGGISDGDSDAKKKAFKRARIDLVAKGRVKTHESRYWIPQIRQGGQKGTMGDMSLSVPDSGGGQKGTHPYKGCPPVPLSPSPSVDVDAEPDRGTNRNKPEHVPQCSPTSGTRWAGTEEEF